MKRTLSTLNPDTINILRHRPESLLDHPILTKDKLSSPSKRKPDSESDLERLNKLINLPYPEDIPKHDRLFDLTEAPVYRPTPQEFSDPHRYIQKIRPEAEKFGICKIIPPEGWRPQFKIDAKTRVQQLNLIGAKTRNKLNYIEKLNAYHSQLNSNKRFCSPMLRKTVDLYLLKEEVLSRGNPRFFKPKVWEEIGRTLGLSDSDSKRNAPSIKELYTSFIVPFELYLKESGSKTPTTNSKPTTPCEKCTAPISAEELLQCSTCKRGYHLKCLKLPMDRNPPPNWSCAPCQKSQDQDFGFSVGKTHTLSSFMKKADKSKLKRFSSEMTNLSTNELENCVEKEFWRLINSPLEPVSVEYGADLHCPNNGSAFPTTVTDPDDPMSSNPWNLSVLPNLPESLFSLLNKQISGITVPWVYTGMCFSTFCWHNEDHYTYSVNYQHWGDTKTWYSIPGSQADKFENAIKSEVPELFEKHPDLLFHLSTLISPQCLLKHDVPVYAADQRPGQFIITFPQAYHAGFNHGFNFNEAVNFASLDWLPYGSSSIINYQKFSRMPVFSHHLLLANKVSENLSKPQALYLLKPVIEMRNDEVANREKILEVAGSSQASPVPSVIPQCLTCNTYCYLSSVTCQCTSSRNKSACFFHFADLCSCSPHHKTLRIHVEQSSLDAFVEKLTRIIDAPLSAM